MALNNGSHDGIGTLSAERGSFRRCIPSTSQGGRHRYNVAERSTDEQLVGRFKNNRRDWEPVGQPHEGNVCVFPDLAKTKVLPYGVYDVRRRMKTLRKP